MGDGENPTVEPISSGCFDVAWLSLCAANDAKDSGQQNALRRFGYGWLRLARCMEEFQRLIENESRDERTFRSCGP